MKYSIILFLCFLFIACQNEESKPLKPQKTVEEIKKDIKQIALQYIKDTNNGNVQAYVNHHLPDKTTYPSEGCNLKEYPSLQKTIL